jgi:ATP-binding cassette, subfamily B, bacterial CvaB/MchF/RaxB
MKLLTSKQLPEVAGGMRRQLDEATSHLDVELEKAINQAIQNLSVTRIVIAHRPQTIAACDCEIHLPDHNHG